MLASDRARLAVVDPGSETLPYDYFYVRQLAKWFDVELFASETAYNQIYLEHAARVPGVRVRPFRIAVGPRVLGALQYARMLATLVSERKRFEAIHFQWSVLPPLEMPVFWTLRERLVVTFHNARPHDGAWYRAVGMRAVYNLARRCVFASEATRAQFMRSSPGVDPGKARVVNHGLMPVRPDAPEAPFDGERLERRIVFWGNVKPYKGIELIERLVRSQLFDDFAFEVHGKWDRALAEVRERLRDAGVYIRDTFLSLGEIEELLGRNAVFILPYARASQSGVMYTLLHHGRFFVASDVGDPAAFLRGAGLDGLVFQRADAAHVRRSVDYLASHAPLAAQQLDRARQQFRWSETVRRELYDELSRGVCAEWCSSP